MMVVPVDAEQHEAQHVHENRRYDAAQRAPVRAMRRAKLEHHDRDENRDDAVTECLESRLVHSPLRPLSVGAVRPSLVVSVTLHAALAAFERSPSSALRSHFAPCAAERSPLRRRVLLGSRQTRRKRAWRQNTSYRPLFLVLISGQIETGSVWRSEGDGRYNRLTEIAIRAATGSLASRR